MKSFKKSVEILYKTALEKNSTVQDKMLRNMLIGAGALGLGGAGLGAMAADPGHRGAGALTGGLLGGLAGAGAGIGSMYLPPAVMERELAKMDKQHVLDLAKAKFVSELKSGGSAIGAHRMPGT